MEYNLRIILRLRSCKGALKSYFNDLFPKKEYTKNWFRLETQYDKNQFEAGLKILILTITKKHVWYKQLAWLPLLLSRCSKSVLIDYLSHFLFFLP